MPVFDELELQVGDRGAFQLHVVVADRWTVSSISGEVLVLDVDTACEADLPIDHRDLAMIPQVDLKAALQRIGLSYGMHLHAGIAGTFEEA